MSSGIFAFAESIGVAFRPLRVIMRKAPDEYLFSGMSPRAAGSEPCRHLRPLPKVSAALGATPALRAHWQQTTLIHGRFETRQRTPMSLKNLTIERFKRLERVDFNLTGNNSGKNNHSWVFPRMRRSNMGRTPTAQSYFGRNCAGLLPSIACGGFQSFRDRSVA
jgi:hypothetical protein